MKRMIAFALAMVLSLSLCACGKKKAAENKAPADPNAGKTAVWVLNEIYDTTGKYEFRLEYEENRDLKGIEYRCEDEDGKVYITQKRYVFDSVGRLLTENVIRNDVNKVFCHSYDIYGNEVNSNCEYTYDAGGKILTVYNNANRKSGTYTYNEAGLLIAKNDFNGQWTYTYDANGRLLTEQDSEGWHATYTYDDKGNLTKYASGYADDTPEWTEIYTYDANGNLSQITVQSPEFDGGKDVVYQLSYEQVYLLPEQANVIKAQQEYALSKVATLTR